MFAILFQIIINRIKGIYKNIDTKCLILIGLIYLSVFVWFYNTGFYKIYISWRNLGLV